MEVEVKVSNLTKEDIVCILEAGFSGDWYGNEHTIKELALRLLEGHSIILKNYKVGGKYILRLNNLCTGIGLFIKNGGSTNISNYDSSDGNRILQYALFGALIFG